MGAFVQGQGGNGGASISGMTVTMAGGATAGNLIVIATATRATAVGSAANVNTPTGWTLLKSYTGSGSAKLALSIFVKVAAGGESSVALTFTATTGSSGNADWVFCEFSGGYTVTVDQVASNNNTTGSPDSGTTPSTTSATEIALVMLTDSTLQVTTPTNSFVAPSGPNGSMTLSMFAYKFLTTTGTQDCGGSSAGTIWAGIIATATGTQASSLPATPLVVSRVSVRAARDRAVFVGKIIRSSAIRAQASVARSLVITKVSVAAAQQRAMLSYRFKPTILKNNIPKSNTSPVAAAPLIVSGISVRAARDRAIYVGRIIKSSSPPPTPPSSTDTLWGRKFGFVTGRQLRRIRRY